MSALFWLYALGGFAVGFPIVFHLIRQIPRGRVTFSSLMFLSSSPPRLTKRSRFDNLLLLLLRALVLILLALAFMRPFLREADDLSLSGIRGRRVAIVIDTSASMRRGDLWKQAKATVDGVLDDLELSDDVALFTCDGEVHVIVDFDGQSNLPPDQKPALIREQLAGLSPTWASTNLGAALVDVAEALDVANDREQSTAALQIVLITDLQNGARLESLQAYEWPDHVHVAVHQVAPRESTNASLQLLVSDDDADDSGDPRVRVSNAENSTAEQFFVSWQSDATRQDRDAAVALYVPPGHSRVIRVPRTEDTLSATRLVLAGDNSFFDNEHFVVPVRQQQIELAYFGDDADETSEEVRFYLAEALAETPRRRVVWAAPEQIESLETTTVQVAVVTTPLSDARQTALRRFAADGGIVFLVLKDQTTAKSLLTLSGASEVADESADRRDNDFALFGEIDFTHPLFAPFASPRYNDFTKIRFWNHRRITFSEVWSARVVARFDDGGPALWEQSLGAGKVFTLAAGWHPSDSELALSSKFVPLMSGILDQAGGDVELPRYAVGDLITLPVAAGADGQAVVIKPDGSEFKLAVGGNTFDSADQPGIYRADIAGQQIEFAVNIAHSESDTSPLAVEQLEQQGVSLGTQTSRSEEFQRQRQLRDLELESKQQIWRWLIVAALVMLIVETSLAGQRSQPTTAEE